MSKAVTICTIFSVAALALGICITQRGRIWERAIGVIGGEDGPTAIWITPTKIQWRVLPEEVKRLKPVYDAVFGKQDAGKFPDVPLADLLSEETKAALLKSGVAWTEIRYAPDDNEEHKDLLSYQTEKYHVCIQRDGTVMFSLRKK